ncbi:cytochrome P450 26A1 isoform X2 [Stegostoma tigrinum]|uniref:cytochrome P450 26A1 isoform X2 n=1 Tax=Stegostoma tigrinum TaxID=3053191 RepID=UPI00202ACCAE|nr:cytochrome P450 26A1 isoform X2 [Stegostoma tigrinum]
MVLATLCATFLCTFVLPLALFLAAVKLWEVYCISGRDPACEKPLPPGSMGLPFLGETLHLVLQRYKFLKMKVRKYGYIYKTHLFGNPTVRIMGAENVKQILLGEHKLVSVQWPASVRTILGAGCLSNLHHSEHKHRKRVILKAFSREALQNYIPVMGEEIRAGVRRWLDSGSSVLVYPEMKRLMFGIAMRILLGFEPTHTSPQTQRELIQVFEEMIRNLFSLPIDVPFSGLYRGLKARNVIHAKIEENIRKKVARRESTGQFKDALQLLIEQSEQPLRLQGLLNSDGTEITHITMELLEQLKYTGSVIKETLRLSPPVPGGFRVALKTFVINGYQIPKGWNVIYSICDTHDVATNFSKKDEFNPDRFMEGCSENDSCRFSYIPFGGGSRSCVGKEFAKILLKIFTVELVRACDWELLNGPPTMKTNPTVYPVDNLPTKFTPFPYNI